MTGTIRPVAIAALLLPLRPSAPPPVHDPFTIMAAFDRIAAPSLWPGFDPGHTPIAIFDGKTTLLFHHPAPPAGFTPLAGYSGIFTYAGRHESIRANTHVVLGGVPSATFILDPGSRSSDIDLAATIVHETFHVFQASRHPGWSGNEGDMLVYPMDDTLTFRLQRLETEALRRAVGARGQDSAACWSRAALALRVRRFGALPVASGVYEQRTELNEGLATYVEYLAAGRLSHWNIPAKGFGPDQVRLRTYSTGPALGALLDRFSTDWKARLEADSTATLDALLGSTLGSTGGTSCSFNAAEETAMAAGARREVADLKVRLGNKLDAFLRQSGWTVEIVVDSGQPL